MRIRLSTTQHRFTIPLPNMLIFSSLFATILTSVINQHLSSNSQQPVQLTGAEMRHLFRAIRQCRHQLKGTPLLYAYSSDGSSVEIYV